MEKQYSNDKNFYYEIYSKNEIFRIRYFLKPKDIDNFAQICGTNSSLFDDITLARKEANRMLEKYENDPNLFY